MANLDMDAFMAARAAAVGLQDLGPDAGTPAPPSADPLERFHQWADGGRLSNVPTLPAILGHLQTFWERRTDPTVALFHYADLLTDLPGQCRRQAQVLGIDLADSRLDDRIAVATFQAMKQRADELVPDVVNRIWRSNDSFFHRGSNGQWRGVLDDTALQHYAARVAELVPVDLATCAHHGWLGSRPAPGQRPTT